MAVSDPLSSVLQHARVDAALFSRACGVTPWGVETRGARSGIFHVLVKGRATLRVGEALHPIEAGDVVVLPHGDAHQLVEPVDAPAVWIGALPVEPGALATVRAGPPGVATTEILCGTLSFSPLARALLAPVLPPVLVARGGPALAPLVGQLAEEVDARAPGADAVTAHLGALLFVVALRQWVATGRAGPSWLGALADPALARAMGLVHADPAHPWTGEELARRVGLSRSVFFERFSAAVGETPAAWITGWRMVLARQALRDRGRSIAEVAGGVGYTDESAFHRAFKRVVGEPPARWRRREVEGAEADAPR